MVGAARPAVIIALRVVIPTADRGVLAARRVVTPAADNGIGTGDGVLVPSDQSTIRGIVVKVAQDQVMASRAGINTMLGAQGVVADEQVTQAACGVRAARTVHDLQIVARELHRGAVHGKRRGAHRSRCTRIALGTSGTGRQTDGVKRALKLRFRILGACGLGCQILLQRLNLCVIGCLILLQRLDLIVQRLQFHARPLRLSRINAG